MKDAIEAFASVSLVLAYFGGMVLAAGWLKLVAFIVPPYALYLVVERCMQLLGMI
jgi:hypothetical protein